MPRAKGSGKKPILVTPEMCKKAEQLAAQGLTVKQIAHCLGMGETSIHEKKRAHKELQEAIDRGKAKGIATITNKLFQKASEGDNTAMIFYLKNRDPENWEDVQKRHVAGHDGGAVKTDNKFTIEIIKPNAKPSDS